METKVKTLILGGGISAISFAHHSANEDYLIIEKEKTLGGLCRSFRIGDSVFDFSGHFMHFKDDKMREYVTNLLKKHKTGEFKEYARDAGIFIVEDGLPTPKVIDYPFQANIHQLSFPNFVDALTDLYEATKPGELRENKNFYDLAVNAFGQKIVDMFFRPYNEKLYRTKLEDLSADAMGRFIPKVNFDEVMQNIKEKKNFGYNSTFLYSPTSGIQGVVDAFLAEKPVNAALAETVLQIDLHEKKVTTSNRTISYENLINTLPLPLFVKLAGLKDVKFKSVDVDVYNITYAEKASLLPKKAWVYFPGDSLFYRVGFYDFMSGVNKTSIYVEISSDTGVDQQISIDAIDAELKRVGVIRKDARIQDSQILKMSPAYAILENSTQEDVDRLKTELAWHNVYITGRYGKWTYQSIEDNILDAKHLAAKFA